MRHSLIATLLIALVSSFVVSANAEEAKKKTVYFMAGKKSHGYGSHEHFAGCQLLAAALRENMPGYEVIVYRDGWPKEPDAFAKADTIVMYCDGGGRHPVNKNLKQLQKLADKGVGVVCIHYGVEVPKGDSGNSLLDWIGGYFEAHWSVNPHWTAEFKKIPDHPITQGVEPFQINDEWYYHMRFRKDMKNVSPILTAIPPAATLSRPDGAHSGNPDVRKTLGQPQHVAWASENENNGRGFGFTGGHFHWNWADDNFRKVVLNAIVWTAHGEIPKGGVGSKRPNLDQLKANQDYPTPKNFNGQSVRDRANLPSPNASGSKSKKKPNQSSAKGNRNAAKALFTSKIVTSKTPGHAVKVDVDITGAKQLYLVVNDAGNGYSCDWADWAEPVLLGTQGKKRLTDLDWKHATTGFGQVHKNKNAGGGPMRLDGSSVEFGIGAHANSVIAFDLPAGYTRFQARAGLDNGGTDQGNCGDSSSVQFQVFTEKPALSGGKAPNLAAASRDPKDAVAALDVADGLEATLAASEPSLMSLTNLDIDHRGRIWVCEVVNYRRHNNKRPEGDRILILEDTDHDGVADTSKVFYQGRDVDSAMGICVLGNRVIVSSSPNVIVFTDVDGDDKPDKKEILFSKTGQPQHDHSAHSFMFGPDGKLYWNFGNTGKAVHDAQGNPIKDISGNTVVDNGKPYYGGMPFRCNLDGSEFEVLAHNFRNNYEVAVDSFGTLWQSDNDDDGNRGVRINFVMEHGNYGYKDEINGAGWRSERTGMHDDIPLRHWHLRDPGVVPNLLQTGAGSPTGITVYEGRLLPKAFWDQVIHCDAGPNVVRAYPAEPYGAGYRASMKNILHGARDNWFRPADVCVAPDGSLFVTDWYDPGVGGHNMQDLQRGRLFRVAPPGHEYKTPTYDYDSIEGCLEALKNPANSVRYMAWTSIASRGNDAEEALLKMYQSSDNPRHRARALWLLARLDSGATHVSTAAKDNNSDIRIAALRAARRYGHELSSLLKQFSSDPSPAVRRECAVALRRYHGDDAVSIWTQLALLHDGEDRWYLEALGIAAKGRWDQMLSAYLEAAGERRNTAAGRDIIWRSRSTKSPGLLAEIVTGGSDESRLERYFRAFDFLAKQSAQAELIEVAFSKAGSNEQTQKLIMSEAVKRLDGYDLSGSPDRVKQLNELLDSIQDEQEFISLVKIFSVKNRYSKLVSIAQQNPDTTVGVSAIRALLDKGQADLLKSALLGEDASLAAETAKAISNSADGRATSLLLPLVRNAKFDLELRRQATRAVARTKNGGQRLIQLAKDEQLDAALFSAAAFHLNASADKKIRGEAAKLFPLPPIKGGKPLPPITSLIQLKGDVARGAKAFATVGQCANCHVVNKQGKEVGPNLSEIGGKLSRQALFESVLFPSAGVSHNYETYSLALTSGIVVKGVLVSKTDMAISIKTDDAITRVYKMDEVEEIAKSQLSLMPADLQKILTSQELVDVVDYMETLKKTE